jgi:hypothetical protein
MTYMQPESIISGLPHRVVDVAGGRAPTALADFVDSTHFTIQQDDTPYLVEGCGVDQGAMVRFHEKDHGPDGKDVRVWAIRQSGDGGFTAEHAAAF